MCDALCLCRVSASLSRLAAVARLVAGVPVDSRRQVVVVVTNEASKRVACMCVYACARGVRGVSSALSLAQRAPICAMCLSILCGVYVLCVSMYNMYMCRGHMRCVVCRVVECVWLLLVCVLCRRMT